MGKFSTSTEFFFRALIALGIFSSLMMKNSQAMEPSPSSGTLKCWQVSKDRDLNLAIFSDYENPESILLATRKMHLAQSLMRNDLLGAEAIKSDIYITSIAQAHKDNGVTAILAPKTQERSSIKEIRVRTSPFGGFIAISPLDSKQFTAQLVEETFGDIVRPTDPLKVPGRNMSVHIMEALSKRPIAEHAMAFVEYNHINIIGDCRSILSVRLDRNGNASSIVVTQDYYQGGK